MPLFEVAVLEVTKHKDSDDTEEIVRKPECILAKTGQAAGQRVLLDLSPTEKSGISLDGLVVIVRPFA